LLGFGPCRDLKLPGVRLNDVVDAARRPEGSAPVLLTPIEEFLAELHARISKLSGGRVADYIPELGKADPNTFGIALATIDGRIYTAGDAGHGFTIQSISKPFMHGFALQQYGRSYVLDRVGVEPTGEAFNSIVLDEVANRPFNPMVNAGAIAVAAMMPGDTPEERTATMLDLFSHLAGHKLEIEDAVFRSELATGHRNRAIAYMMLNTGMIGRDPIEALDLYFRQCSITVTCRDLAIMAATLANDGINPLTGLQLYHPHYVRDVLSVMNSCGMYNYAGQWSYEVGMPAKSGVSGGILAVIPGQVGIGVYSPPLDAQGNSVRGIKVCQEISNEFELHVFNNRTNVTSVIRRDFRGDRVRSSRLRTAEQRELLGAEGDKIAVVEAQGPLFFGSTEQLLRRVSQIADTARFIVIDFKRVNLADTSAHKLTLRFARAMQKRPTELLFAEIASDGPLSELSRLLADNETERLCRVFKDVDTALEWCEDQLLLQLQARVQQPKFALATLDVFKGLSPEEVRLVEAIVNPLIFEKGEVIIREGDHAKLFFVLARGTVSVQIKVPTKTGERKRRVASLGPGLTFGEMALFDGGARSADVIADERVICYGLAVEQLKELGVTHPNIMVTILANLTRDFSERLRHANEAISTLE
jgi:glutaminase